MSTVVRIEARVLLMGLSGFAINPSSGPTSFNIEIVVAGKTLSEEVFFDIGAKLRVTPLAKVGTSIQLPQELVLAT